MSVPKGLTKCFVCFQPTEKFGVTENTFLSVVMLLRMEGHLPYPPKGSPVLIKDWDPCEPCVPKTLDLYKEYAKFQKKTVKRRRKVKDVIREEMATIAETVISSNNKSCEENDDGRKEKKNDEKARYAEPCMAPGEAEASPKKKKRRKAFKGQYEPEKSTSKRFKCPRCSSNFKFKCSMTRHIRAFHEKLRPFKCPKCPLKYSCKLILQRHIVAAHGKNGPLTCPRCPSSFQLPGVLSRHIIAAHSHSKKGNDVSIMFEGEEEEIPQQKGPRSLSKAQKGPSLSTDRKTGSNKQRLKCPQCPISFKANFYLQRHSRAVHERVRDFKCPQCPLSFSTDQNLQRHIIVVHEGVRDFKCPHCSKTFTQRRYLRDHVAMVHEGRVLHKCPWPNCKSTFTEKKNVNIHVQAVHEKRRDFKCHICDKGFPRKADCARHVREVHRKI